MLSDADKELNSAVEKFSHFIPSIILHHGKDCCVMAHEWFKALDISFLIDGSIYSAPSWIRSQWKWGGMDWPLFWCQVPDLKTLDCGALAALSCEAFRQRGLSVFSVQLIQRFSLHDAYHWDRKWAEKGLLSNWISGSLVYHEACAVLIGPNQVRVWDPTDNTWLRPSQCGGYATTVAVRFVAEGYPAKIDVLKWEYLVIPSNTWIKIC